MVHIPRWGFSLGTDRTHPRKSGSTGPRLRPGPGILDFLGWVLPEDRNLRGRRKRGAQPGQILRGRSHPIHSVGNRSHTAPQRGGSSWSQKQGCSRLEKYETTSASTEGICGFSYGLSSGWWVRSNTHRAFKEGSARYTVRSIASSPTARTRPTSPSPVGQLKKSTGCITYSGGGWG